MYRFSAVGKVRKKVRDQKEARESKARYCPALCSNFKFSLVHMPIQMYSTVPLFHTFEIGLGRNYWWITGNHIVAMYITCI